MKKTNLSVIRQERVIENKELLSLKGGVEECPCGAQKQWWCSISNYGVNLFSGIACGEMEYILSVYPASQGYVVDCSGGLVCSPMRIGG